MPFCAPVADGVPNSCGHQLLVDDAAKNGVSGMVSRSLFTLTLTLTLILTLGLC